MHGEDRTEKPSEEQSIFGRETVKYFNKERLAKIMFDSALIFEAPIAAGGWVLQMGGVGVKKLSDNFPEESKVIDALLEYANIPADFLIENMGKGYAWSKDNIIFLSGKVFGSEDGTKVAEGIGGIEKEVGDVADKFKPTEEQGYALKLLEVIGLTKLFASLAKFGASKLVKDTKIDGKYDLHADTVGKIAENNFDNLAQNIKTNPSDNVITEGGRKHAYWKESITDPNKGIGYIEFDRKSQSVMNIAKEQFNSLFKEIK